MLYICSKGRMVFVGEPGYKGEKGNPGQVMVGDQGPPGPPGKKMLLFIQ